MTETTKSNSGGAGIPRTVEMTPGGDVASPHIGDPLLVIQNGVANRVNEHLQIMASIDESGILQTMEAVMGDEGPDDQSVYIRARGSKKPGAKRVNMAILRISDHPDKQKRKTDAETRTLRVDDVITWTLNGFKKGRWKDVTDKVDRTKHKSDPDVIFMLVAKDADTKIYDGFEIIIKMLNRVFKENGINVVL